MEEKLIKFVEARSPDTSREAVMSMLCSEELIDIVQSDYNIARSSGLTITESKHALLLAQEIRKLGIETILAKANSLTTSNNVKPITVKRKRRKEEEPELKKRTKF